MLDRCGLTRRIDRLVDMEATIPAPPVKRFRKRIRELLFGPPDDHQVREVASRFGYNRGFVIKPIEEQIMILHDFWPKLKPGKRVILLEREERVLGVEGLYASIRWEKLAPNYGEALEKEILTAIGSTREFHNWRGGRLGPEHFRMSKKTAKMSRKLGNQQEGDIQILAAQFGLWHRGRPVLWVREILETDEFGLSSLANGCMLLTHPERLQTADDLFIDCAGDEYASNGQFISVPFFMLSGGKVLQFGVRRIDAPSPDFGSSTGWLI